MNDDKFRQEDENDANQDGFSSDEERLKFTTENKVLQTMVTHFNTVLDRKQEE